MQFYNDKFRKIREEKKIKITELALKMELNRNTLWLWEAGRIQPTEKKVRLLANVLDISVDKISDLQPEILTANGSDIEHSKAISSWISFADKSLLSKKIHNVFLLKDMEEQLDRACQIETILYSLINFSDVMLYVKDTSQKYLAASKAFTNLVSLDNEQSIIGKTDEDLFPQKEAKANSDEDAHTMLTGEAVKNRESFIPGSRKQKWGLISKIVTFDTKGKVTGIVGSFIDITRRKQAESTSDKLKHFINMMNKGIWLGNGKLVFDEQIAPKNLLYISRNNFCKTFFLQGSGLSLSEQIDYFNSLRLDKAKQDLKTLKEKGFYIAKDRVKNPDTGEIVNMKASFYYDSAMDLYFSIIERDEVKDAVESMKNDVIDKLRKLKVDDTIIKSVFD